MINDINDKGFARLVVELALQSSVVVDRETNEPRPRTAKEQATLEEIAKKLGVAR